MGDRNKIMAYGSPFSHVNGSCNDFIPDRVEWVYDSEFGVGDNLVFFDYNHDGGLSVPKIDGVHKFLWLCESRGITPEQHRDVYNRKDLFLSEYDGIFTCDEQLLGLDDRFIRTPNGSNLPWVRDRGIHSKNKMVSMICSGKVTCDGHQVRNQVASSLNGKIDLFGRGINPIDKKEDGLKDYMFSVAMENTRYETYYTEKIMDCFATGTIPIYWGSPDIGDHFNLDGIIVLEEDYQDKIKDLSPELYYDKMDAIKENYERCMEVEMADDLVCDKIMEIVNC
tara:strand:- start:5201 stop:6043 length:843 start_codon:yes stop_codon:yes gene_type:complete